MLSSLCSTLRNQLLAPFYLIYFFGLICFRVIKIDFHIGYCFLLQSFHLGYFSLLQVRYKYGIVNLIILNLKQIFIAVWDIADSCFFFSFSGMPINKQLYSMTYMLLTTATAGFTFCVLYLVVRSITSFQDKCLGILEII